MNSYCSFLEIETIAGKKMPSFSVRRK